MTSEATYSIDYKKMVLWLTPNRLRKTRMLAWLGVLVNPVVVLYQNFLAFRKTKLYYLGISPSVCDLERLLNDRYDFTQRRIYIDDAQDKPIKYIFRRLESKPKFLRRRSEASPLILYTRNESGINAIHFIVYVPVSIVFDLQEMKSLINIYKLLGKRYKVQTF
jgi:hypothetical protein